MTRRKKNGEESAASDITRGEEFHALVSKYLDRLNSGEKLDPLEIVTDHPQMAQEILEDLELYIDLDESNGTDSGRPLGTLGDYTLRRQIGRGGMGVVYEAWENSMDRAVALKVLPSGLAADNKAFVRFMREAKTAGQLNHPNIVYVHGLGLKEQTPYYAMELVKGETLAQILTRLRAAEGKDEESQEVLQGLSQLFARGMRKGPTETVDANAVHTTTEKPKLPDTGSSAEIDNTLPEYCYHLARIFAGVADGLQHAHSKGVIHRDIKPSNLIFDGEGRLRILDFGLAQLEGQETLTLSGDLLGTVLYMSPEQAMAKRVPLDHRTDIYSLGATLYEMLTWHPPFMGKDSQDTLSQIIFQEPKAPSRLNSRIPRDLETIVLKCLQKDPQDRYGTAEALGQDLRRFVRGDAIEASPQPSWEKVARLLKRNRGKVITTSVILILLLCATWLAWSKRVAELRLAEERYEPQVVEAVMKLLRGQLTFKAAAGRVDLFLPEDDRLLLAADDAWGLPVREAVKSLTDVANTVPRRPQAHYHLARALLRLGRKEEAADRLRLALRCEPPFVPAAILLAELEGKPGVEAEMQREAAWTKDWLRGHRARKKDDWEEAVEAFGKLVAKGATSPEQHSYPGLLAETYLWRGVACLQLKDFERAKRSFIEAGARWPGALEPRLLLAKTYFLEARMDLAEEEFHALHEEAGDRKDETAFWIASVLLSLNAYKEGLQWADKISEPSIQARLKAYFHINFQEFKKAAAFAKEAIELNPQDSLAHAMRALTLYLMLGDRFGPRRNETLADIKRLSERAIALKEDSAWGYGLMAAASWCQGDARTASKCTEKALKCDPKNAMANWSLYGADQPHGEYEKAEKQLRRAQALAKNSPYLPCMLGETLLLQDKYEDAEEAFEHALALNPNYLDAHKLLGDLFFSQGQYQRAIVSYENGKATHLQDWVFLERKAYALWKQGRLPDALREVEESIHQVSDRPSAHLIHALILKDQGEATAATSAFCRALDLNPDCIDFQNPSVSRFLYREAYAVLLPLLRQPHSGEERDRLLTRLESHRRARLEHRLDVNPFVLMALASLSQTVPGRVDSNTALEYALQAVEETRSWDPDLLPEMQKALAEVQLARDQRNRSAPETTDATAAQGGLR